MPRQIQCRILAYTLTLDLDSGTMALGDKGMTPLATWDRDLEAICRQHAAPRAEAYRDALRPIIELGLQLCQHAQAPTATADRIETDLGNGRRLVIELR